MLNKVVSIGKYSNHCDVKRYERGCFLDDYLVQVAFISHLSQLALLGEFPSPPPSLILGGE
jgi:hypothetical protein